MTEKYKMVGDNESTATIRVGVVKGFTDTYVGFIEFRDHGQYLYGERCRVERLTIADAIADARQELFSQGDWRAV